MKKSTNLREDLKMTERNFQQWRALALFIDETESLICLGPTDSFVREKYLFAIKELFDIDAIERMTEIELQKWIGTANQGSWEGQCYLPVPIPSGVAKTI